MSRLFSIAILFSCGWIPVTLALDLSTEIEVIREGKPRAMVLTDGWFSEYPSPIIHVLGIDEVQIEGYDSIELAETRITCGIVGGLYHPWSETPNNVTRYLSVNPVVNYRVLRRAVIDDVSFTAGDLVAHEVYLSEGFCRWTAVRTGRAPQEVVDMCEVVADSKVFTREEVPGHDPEQWLHITCSEGHDIFVRDEDLLSQPGVEYGNLIAYGEVGPFDMELGDYPDTVTTVLVTVELGGPCGSVTFKMPESLDVTNLRAWDVPQCQFAPVVLAEGEKRWIVVRASLSGASVSDSQALESLSRLRADGVLWSSYYPSLRPNFWVVYNGPFLNRAEAISAAATISGDSYVRILSNNEKDR